MEDQREKELNVKGHLTSAEVCKKYKISKYTLQNWRRGFFIRKGKKYLYLESEEGLPYRLNTNLLQPRAEYNPIKIAVWINKMKAERMSASHAARAGIPVERFKN